MKKNDRNESEAIAFLAQGDVTMEELAVRASAESESVRKSTEQHGTALARFKKTGEGLLPALAARAFLRNFSDLTAVPGVQDLGASAEMHRTNWFDGQKRRLEAAARSEYLRANAREIGIALETIISVRGVGREAWRSKIADEIAALDRGLLLGTTSMENQPRVRGRLVLAENELVSADVQHEEALRLTARLKTGSDADIATLYGDAKGFVMGLPTYEVA